MGVKYSAPFKSVKVSDDGMSLIIEVPIDQTLPLSLTGKSRVVYTSAFPRPTKLFIGEKEIFVMCTAYIER